MLITLESISIMKALRVFVLVIIFFHARAIPAELGLDTTIGTTAATGGTSGTAGTSETQGTSGTSGTQGTSGPGGTEGTEGCIFC